MRTDDEPATSPAEPATPASAVGVWRNEARLDGPLVIVDIDGVLADTSARQHLLDGPDGRRDWDTFFAAAGDDRPLTAVPAVLAALDDRCAVVLVSGRPSWLTDTTVQWLERHGVRWDLLLVRRAADRSPAARFKTRVLAELVAAGHEVLFAVDDDERVVAAYRAAGVATLHPGTDISR